MIEPANFVPSSSQTDFIHSLIAKMTLEEKVGQMVQKDLSTKADLVSEAAQGSIGALLTIKDPDYIRACQNAAKGKSRLKIPLLVGNDIIHGYKLTYPIPLALACSWNPEMIAEIARQSAIEARQHGTNWIFAPMVDICRDSRWGRVAESTGEDTYLSSRLAEAWVCGFQSLPQIAACVKHFAAYGAVEAGRDYNTVDISERTLREVYLPPFKAAIQAGAKSIMPSFTDLNGLPATINPLLLTQILRREWGFQGVVVSDYDAIGELVHHRVCANLREAALKSLLAGIDIDMMSGAYQGYLIDLVENGSVPSSLIDDAVFRILQMKLEIGLFDAEAPITLESQTNRGKQLALDAALQSTVLLKNEGNVLPIQPDRMQKIVLIGPFAANTLDLLGCWTFDPHTDNLLSLENALRLELNSEDCLLVEDGCDFTSDSWDHQRSIQAAKAADIVVLALGEPAAMSGEAHSRAHLNLPGAQQQLAQSILALDKQVVLIIFAGRPLCIPQLDEAADAVIYAWHGGQEAAKAVAQLITGKKNPSGKLAITIPRSEGQIPIYYNHKSTGRPYNLKGTFQFNQEHRSIYIDESVLPLYPFGHGLSYSSFAITDLSIQNPHLQKDSELVFTVKVRNTGLMRGTEVLQVYYQDCVSAYTRPVKELVAFRRLELDPGEQETLYFRIPASSFCTLDAAYQPYLDLGEYKLWLASSSQQGLEAFFSIH